MRVNRNLHKITSIFTLVMSLIVLLFAVDEFIRDNEILNYFTLNLIGLLIIFAYQVGLVRKSLSSKK